MRSRTLAALPLLVIAAFSAYSQTVSPGGIVNAASFQPAVAPGSVISIFGANLAAAATGASAVPLPTALSGTSVLVDGVPAPLFYVSPSQINAQLPYETAPGQASLVVRVNGSSSASASFTVSTSAPGILVWGSNRAVALNQDGPLNSPDKPALPGTVITLYMVGQGPVDTPVATGAASPSTPVAHASLRVTATIGGRSADVLFAGLSPGGVGLFQVNLRVPASVSGDCPLVVTIGGAASNSVMLAVAGTNPTPSSTNVVRTIAYHQLTAIPDNGPDLRSSTILSGNGAVIAFAISPGSTRATSPNRIYTMNFDGSGQTQIDSYTTQCYCGSIVDITDDASKVVSTEGRQIRIVDAQGARAMVTVDTGVAGIKISGDGRRVFFLLDRDQRWIGSGGTTSPAQRGLYVINADGSGLRQIVGPNAIAALFGMTITNNYEPQFTVTGNAANHSLSVSRDGSRILFGAQKRANGGADGIFGVNLDGSGLHFVLGPVPYVEHLAMSEDSAKTLYDIYDRTWVETGVINFDGSGRLVLRKDGIGNRPGVQLTADGTQALAFDILYNTDGSGALQLSTTFNSLTPGSPVMNAAASRFVYSFVAPGTYSQGLTQLASAEINPAGLGLAPSILSPSVNPGYVVPNDTSKATATARVSTTNRVIGVSYAIVRDGLIDPPHDGDAFLLDDGSNGDQTAGDGVFTSGNVHAPSGSLEGPRLLRLFGQVMDAAGKRHGTLIDVAPFSVVLRAP
jgi:uncharacterized protein (TIGR03437 family)